MKTDTMQQYEDEQGRAVIEVHKDHDGNLLNVVIFAEGQKLALDADRAKALFDLLDEVELE